MLLVIDNYDSFTYNLVQYFQELGQTVLVRRNDCVTLEEIIDLNPRAVVISPGPGGPRDAGISMQVIRDLGDRIPILEFAWVIRPLARSWGTSSFSRSTDAR